MIGTIPSGTYFICATSLTHNQVLLRNIDDGKAINCDILIDQVQYVSVPFRFEIDRISISQSPKFEGNKFIFNKNFPEFYIVGRRLLYSENDLSKNESSMPVHREDQGAADAFFEAILNGEPYALPEDSIDWKVIVDA